MANKRLPDTRQTETALEEKLDTEEAKTPRKFKEDDTVVCRSCTPGLMILEGARSGNIYRFMGVNDVLEVEYKDVLAELRGRTGYITRPMFIVEDEDFVQQNPYLKTIYDNMYPVSELEKIFELPASQIRRVIAGLPEGVQRSVESMAATKIRNEEIDSLRMIHTLEDIFGKNFSVLVDDGE